MNITLHVGLDRFFQFFRLVIPIFFCAGLPVVQMWQESDASRLTLITMVLGPLLIALAWWLLPVPCIRQECAGRMRRSAERISFWTVRATYTCEDCGDVHQVDVFNPNIEITSGDY